MQIAPTATMTMPPSILLARARPSPQIENLSQEQRVQAIAYRAAKEHPSS